MFSLPRTGWSDDGAVPPETSQRLPPYPTGPGPTTCRAGSDFFDLAAATIDLTDFADFQNTLTAP